MKWSVLIESDRPCSAVIFPLKLLQPADRAEALNQNMLIRVIV